VSFRRSQLLPRDLAEWAVLAVPFADLGGVLMATADPWRLDALASLHVPTASPSPDPTERWPDVWAQKREIFESLD
jgi:hypothetical protein